MSKSKVNKENRDDIQQRWIEHLVSKMDTKTLVVYVLSSLEFDYNHYSDTELEEEILDNCEDFEWEIEN